MKTGTGLLAATTWCQGGVGVPAESAAGLGRTASGAMAGRGAGESRVRGLPASLVHNLRPMCTLVAGVAVRRRPVARPANASARRRDP